ncbi:MarR family winged helix-turn-helix transcriptional regulator [Brachybacterium aquaticum]|uniref:DNA-binding MarR family transcriptional regulator n=1 Tax=Brachybacterium aquaticum TaxID=1432564 RepID=A0A841ABL4_9MICO|nr:MarR family transcriptional regulator [Brachybacterium aquaticum]MBB5830584.1 DNA-binding MarR family transcriptional regulator [Brachybacterium aquaticum]
MHDTKSSAEATVDAPANSPAAPDDDRASTPEELWLTGREQEAWRIFLYATTMLNDRFSEALQSDPEIDLALGEYEILVRLAEAEGGFLRMSELADKVVHSRSRLTHTISRMEKRGLVERIRCAADGRGRQAQLTAAGQALLEKAAPTHVRSVREQLLDVIGHDDLLELGRILGKTLGEDAPVTIGCPAPHAEAAAPR